MHCALPAETPPRNQPPPLSLARIGSRHSFPDHAPPYRLLAGMVTTIVKEPHEP
jgi:hypothetical protein